MKRVREGPITSQSHAVLDGTYLSKISTTCPQLVTPIDPGFALPFLLSQRIKREKEGVNGWCNELGHGGTFLWLSGSCPRLISSSRLNLTGLSVAHSFIPLVFSHSLIIDRQPSKIEMGREELITPSGYRNRSLRSLL